MAEIKITSSSLTQRDREREEFSVTESPTVKANVITSDLARRRTEENIGFLDDLINRITT